MVSKNLGLADDLVFGDVHETYPEPQLEEIYEEVFSENDFSNAHVLLLTGGPNEEEESQRREDLTAYLEEFRETRDSFPILVTTPSQKKALDEEERISENDYIFHPIEPNSSVDEVESVKQELSEAQSLAVFTNDYHVPRYESILNSSLDDSIDYIVFGSELRENEEEYSDKWISEAIRTAIPQNLKDIGKKYLR